MRTEIRPGGAGSGDRPQRTSVFVAVARLGVEHSAARARAALDGRSGGRHHARARSERQPPDSHTIFTRDACLNSVLTKETMRPASLVILPKRCCSNIGLLDSFYP